MDPKFIAVIRYDFCPISKEEEVYNQLKESYGSKPEEFGGSTFSGGSWSNLIYGDRAYPGSSEREFEYVRSIVEQNTEQIIDITTVGLLSDAQTAEIYDIDDRKVSSYLDDLFSHLDSVSANLPTVVDRSPSTDPSILYCEPVNRIKPDFEEGRPVPESIYGDQDLGIFRKLRILPQGNTTFWGEDMVNSWASMQRWGKLSVLNLSSTCDNPADDWITTPVWLGRVNRLKPYQRAFHWLSFRLNEIRETEFSKDFGNSVSNTLTNELDIDSLLSIQQDFGYNRQNWTQFWMKAHDEIDDLRWSFGQEGIDGRTDSSATVFHDAEDSGIFFAETPLPLDDYYLENVKLLLNRITNSIERVDEKQTRAATFLHDQIRARATMANIGLQNRIRSLTLYLLILTTILVALEVAPVLTQLLSGQ